MPPTRIEADGRTKGLARKQVETGSVVFLENSLGGLDRHWGLDFCEPAPPASHDEVAVPPLSRSKCFFFRTAWHPFQKGEHFSYRTYTILETFDDKGSSLYEAETHPQI